MKGKKLSLLLIMLLLAVGFAAVATNLILNGNTKIGMSDFDVYFSEANAENENDFIEISQDKHSLSFSTRTLSIASEVDDGDNSIFNFTVTNDSVDYDAEVEFNLNISSTFDYTDYLSIVLFNNDEQRPIYNGAILTIPAQSSLNGMISVGLLKPVTEDYTIDFGLDINPLPKSRLSAAAPVQGFSIPHQELAAGLYDTNMNLIKSWDELKAENIIYVEDGLLSSNYNYDVNDRPNIPLIGGEKPSEGGGAGEVEMISKLSNSLNSLLGGVLLSSNDVYSSYDENNSSCSSLNGVLVIDEEVERTANYNFICSGLKGVVFKQVDSDTYWNNIDGFRGIKVFNGISEDETITGYKTGYYFSSGNARIQGDWAYDANDSNRIVAYLGNSENVVIPEGVTEISGPAFALLRINNITYPSSLHNLGDGVFSHIINTEIEISGTVNEIGSYLIDGSDIESVTLSNGIRIIDEEAFINSNLEELHVPSSVTSIGLNAFGSVFYLYYDGNASYGNYDRYWGAYYLNPYIENDYIYSSSDKTVLQGYIGGDETITISNTVTTIADDALSNTIVKNVIIPNTVTTIGRYAFDNDIIKNVEVPSSVVNLDDEAFHGLITVIYNGSLNPPDDHPNWGASYLNYLYDNGFIITLDGKTLYEYVNPKEWYDKTYKDLYIPDGIENINASVFKYEYYLNKIYLPSSVKVIGDEAFSYVKDAVEISIPDTVESIGNRAFSGAINLIYSGSLTPEDGDNNWGALFKNKYYEGDLLFDDDTKTKIVYCINNIHAETGVVKSYDLVIPEGVEVIGSSAFSPSNKRFKVTSITWPTTLKRIESSAFYKTTNMQSISFPQGLEYIDISAFYVNSFKSIYIPSSVSYIGACAFKYTENGTPGSGNMYFEDHARWKLTYYSNTIYHEPDDFNDSAAIYQEMASGSVYDWEKVS